VERNAARMKQPGRGVDQTASKDSRKIDHPCKDDETNVCLTRLVMLIYFKSYYDHPDKCVERRAHNGIPTPNNLPTAAY
jgi:hypothetical protein